MMRWIKQHVGVLAWLAWGGVVVGWMIWRDTHLPNCTALYGVYSGHDDVSLWLDCSRENESSIFETQFIAILALVGSIIAIAIGAVILAATEAFLERREERHGQ